MDLMIARKVEREQDLIVILQDNGYAVPLGSNDVPIKLDSLLFPKEYDENLPKYLSSSIQGLLSNPNIVKELDALDKGFSLYEILFRAEEIALRLCYDTPLTEFVPLDQSFLKDKEECLKKFIQNIKEKEQ